MKIKLWSVVPCAMLTLVACDVADSDVEAQSVEVDGSRASFAASAPTDGLIAQNYCDHAARVTRAEFLKSDLEADANLAHDRERALLDDVRAGEAVFAGAERLALRNAAEVHLGFEGGFLVATAPRVDAPLAKLRLANGVKVHLFAHGVRKLVLSESITKADIGHLIVMTDLDGAVDVQVEGVPGCLVIDGGGDAATGPLNVNGSAKIDDLDLDLAIAPKPVKANIWGTEGPDTIYGTVDGDWIWGGGGDDYIRPGGSGDIAFGQAGNDTLWEEPWPWNPQNSLYGGYGNDYLHGGYGNTRCLGEMDTDFCEVCYGLYDSCP